MYVRPTFIGTEVSVCMCMYVCMCVYVGEGFKTKSWDSDVKQFGGMLL